MTTTSPQQLQILGLQVLTGFSGSAGMAGSARSVGPAIAAPYGWCCEQHGQLFVGVELRDGDR